MTTVRSLMSSIIGTPARAGGESVSDARADLLDEFRRTFEPVKELAAGEYLP